MKYKILVVDDEPANLRMIDRLLRNDCTVVTAESGREALSLLAQHDFALIISDQRMPGMTGIEFLKKAAVVRHHTVRIILTGYTDIVDLVEAINSGIIYKYVTKPWVNGDLKQTVSRALEHYETTKAQHLLGLENQRLESRLARSVEGFVSAVSNITSRKMLGLGGHCDRTAVLAAAIGRKLGLDTEQLQNLANAARLHEVAHLNFAADAVDGQPRYTTEQLRAGRDAYEHGLALISSAPELSDVETIIRYQHEHFDGSGFFDALDGDKIPLESRILAVANAVDDMTSGNDMTGNAEILEWLRGHSGTRFDPRVVDACVALEDSRGSAHEMPPAPVRALYPISV